MRTHASSVLADVLVARSAAFALIASASLMTGCGDDTDAPTENPPEVGHVLHLDLEAFETDARARLVATFGEAGLGEGEVWFRDGVSDGVEPYFDFGAIYYVAALPEAMTPWPGTRAAYRMRLQGEGEIVLVDLSGDPVQLAVAFPGSGGGSFTEGTTVEEVEAFEADQRATFPSLDLEILAEIRVMTFTVAPEQLRAVIDAMNASGLFSPIEPNVEMYAAPFEFADAARVTAGADGLVDLTALTTITLPLRGVRRFSTAPSLPAPFGPGPIGGDEGAGYLVSLAEGAVMADCQAEIATRFPTLMFQDGGPVAFLVLGGRDTELAVATIAMLECVASVEAQTLP